LPVWADQQEGASETITASNEGVFIRPAASRRVSDLLVVRLKYFTRVFPLWFDLISTC